MPHHAASSPPEDNVLWHAYVTALTSNPTPSSSEPSRAQEQAQRDALAVMANANTWNWNVQQWKDNTRHVDWSALDPQTIADLAVLSSNPVVASQVPVDWLNLPWTTGALFDVDVFGGINSLFNIGIRHREDRWLLGALSNLSQPTLSPNFWERLAPPRLSKKEHDLACAKLQKTWLETMVRHKIFHGSTPITTSLVMGVPGNRVALGDALLVMGNKAPKNVLQILLPTMAWTTPQSTVPTLLALFQYFTAQYNLDDIPSWIKSHIDRLSKEILTVGPPWHQVCHLGYVLTEPQEDTPVDISLASLTIATTMEALQTPIEQVMTTQERQEVENTWRATHPHWGALHDQAWGHWRQLPIEQLKEEAVMLYVHHQNAHVCPLSTLWVLNASSSPLPQPVRATLFEQSFAPAKHASLEHATQELSIWAMHPPHITTVALRQWWSWSCLTVEKMIERRYSLEKDLDAKKQSVAQYLEQCAALLESHPQKETIISAMEELWGQGEIMMETSREYQTLSVYQANRQKMMMIQQTWAMLFENLLEQPDETPAFNKKSSKRKM